MPDQVFESAADRIAFSEAVDYLEQDRLTLVPQHLIDLYLRKGLWVEQQGGTFVLSEEGRRQHQIALRERYTDG
jgi:hypothetical protein